MDKSETIGQESARIVVEKYNLPKDLEEIVAEIVDYVIIQGMPLCNLPKRQFPSSNQNDTTTENNELRLRDELLEKYPLNAFPIKGMICPSCKQENPPDQWTISKHTDQLGQTWVQYTCKCGNSFRIH